MPQPPDVNISSTLIAISMRLEEAIRLIDQALELSQNRNHMPFLSTGKHVSKVPKLLGVVTSSGVISFKKRYSLNSLMQIL